MSRVRGHHRLWTVLWLTVLSVFVSAFQVTHSSILIPPSSSTSLAQRRWHKFVLRSNISKNNGEDEKGGNRRRKKKNKYASFSKADKMESDPLETLISQANRENARLKRREAARKQGRLSDDEDGLEDDSDEDAVDSPRVRNKRTFPDLKTIDPYDPTTYGYAELGTILGPHGVHGLMRLSASTGFPVERLCRPGIRHLKAPNRRSPREVRLMEGRKRLKDEYLVRLEGVVERDAAGKLRGSVLYARQEERPEDIGEDEFMVDDLVGLDVHLVTGYGEDGDKENWETDAPLDEDGEYKGKGTFVGTVRGVILAEEMCSIPGLGHDMLEIILPRGKNGTPSWRDEMVMIPHVVEIVPTVDLERSLIYIDPPEGLLDLTYVHEEKVRIKALLPPAKE